MKSPVPMHCPSFNIFGTFFPSWMLCALIGIVGTIVVFRLVAGLHAQRFVPVPLVVYPCVALSLTSLAWLGWYGN
jgi:YtcA family